MNLRSNFKFLVYLSFLSFYASESLANPKHSLHIFTEYYPPYSMSVNGQPYAHKAEDITGLCTELVVAMLSRTDIPYKIKMRSLSSALSTSEHKGNTAIYCEGKSEERDQYFHWIGPLVHSHWTFFAKSGSTIKIGSLEDAKKYKIGGYKGDVMTEHLIQKGYKVSVISNNALNPRRLELGQIDLWIADKLEGPYLAAEYDTSEIVPVFTFKESPLYLAVNKETDSGVVSKLHEAYGKIVNSGDFQAITNSYIRY